MTNLPNDVHLNILDCFTHEWARVREPLYQTYEVSVSGYVQTTKRQLYTLSLVNRYFRTVLLPHIFHTIVFRGSHFLFNPVPHDYRQFCTELLEGQSHAVAIAALVKECIFATWSPNVLGETASNQHKTSLQDRMEQDLRAVERMTNLRILRFNDAVVPFTSLARTLSALPNVEILRLGELETSPEPGPLIEAMRDAPVLSELVLHEMNLGYLAQTSFPHVRTLRIPFLRSWESVRTLFEVIPSLLALKALHIDQHWEDVSRLVRTIDSLPQRLERITCPVELAPVLLPGQPLRTVALRLPNLFNNGRDTTALYAEAVAALKETTGELQTLEVSHRVCMVDKWMFKAPVLALRKLTITVTALSVSECDTFYDGLWRQFEARPLPHLTSFEMVILNHQLDFPFQHRLLTRLYPTPFPSLDRVCFSQYLSWYRTPEGVWIPEKTMDPGEPISWFRNHNREWYTTNSLNTNEVLVGDRLFDKAPWTGAMPMIS